MMPRRKSVDRAKAPFDELHKENKVIGTHIEVILIITVLPRQSR